MRSERSTSFWRCQRDVSKQAGHSCNSDVKLARTTPCTLTTKCILWLLLVPALLLTPAFFFQICFGLSGHACQAFFPRVELLGKGLKATTEAPTKAAKPYFWLPDAQKDAKNDSPGARKHEKTQTKEGQESGNIQLIERARTRKWRVAVMVLVMPASPPPWRDALAVLAHSVNTVLRRNGTIAVDLLAVAHESMGSQECARLEEVGYTVFKAPYPVLRDRIREHKVFHHELTKNCKAEASGGCLLVDLLKLYSVNQLQYDRAVMVDGDVLFLQDIDSLLFDPLPLLTTYDHELDFWPDFSGRISAIPVVNSGFWVVTPNHTDFDEMIKIMYEGDFRLGSGWRGKKVGWGYGGPGTQGITAYWYNIDALSKKETMVKRPDLPGDMTIPPRSSRIRALDRSIYNVIETADLKQALKNKLISIENIRVFHFTGKFCGKPWDCAYDRKKRGPICMAMVDRWWTMRAELAKARGITNTPACKQGSKYEELGWRL